MESRIIDLIGFIDEVNNLVEDRIYPQAIPDKSDLPAISFSLLSTTTSNEFDGQNEIIKARLQLQVWSKKYATSKQISKALTSFFSGHSETLNGFRFHSIFLENVIDLYNGDQREYGNNIDLIINYEDLT